MARGPNLKADQIRMLKDLHALGKCDREICMTMGKTRSAIGNLRRGFNLAANPDPDYGAPLSDDEEAKLRLLFEAKKTDKEIAQAMNINRGIVYRQRRRLRLSRVVASFKPDIYNLGALIDKEERETAMFWRRARSNSDAFLQDLLDHYEMPIPAETDLGRRLPRSFIEAFSAVGSPAAMCSAE